MATRKVPVYRPQYSPPARVTVNPIRPQVPVASNRPAILSAWWDIFGARRENTGIVPPDMNQRAINYAGNHPLSLRAYRNSFGVGGSSTPLSGVSMTGYLPLELGPYRLRPGGP